MTKYDPMYLSEYLQKFGTSNRKLAIKADLEPTTITDFLNYGRDIRMSSAIKIQKATDDIVTVEKLDEEARKIKKRLKTKIIDEGKI